MATYRQIYTKFWSDAKVSDEFTPEDKYFYLYLLTNPNTSLTGCYEVSYKTMSRETGYNEDTVKHLMYRMETVHKVICFDKETKEVLIPHWHKYNWTSSDKLIRSVKSQTPYIKSKSFREYVEKLVDGDTVCIPYTYGMDTSVSVSVSVSKSNSDSYKEDFDKFWSIYPKKKDKQNAMKAFKKVTVPVDELIAAVEKQKKWESWTREDGRYIPYPTTWLNGKRWEDESGEFRIDDPESYEEVDPW